MASLDAIVMAGGATRSGHPRARIWGIDRTPARSSEYNERTQGLEARRLLDVLEETIYAEV